MPVFNDADDMKLGGSQVDKVYLGSTEVWAPAPVGGSYDTEVLADSPWAYWRMEETSGSSLTDETGNGRSATNNGGDLTAVGQHGSAVQLDGTNDYINVGTLPFWTNVETTGVTFEFWFKSSSTTQDLLWGCFNSSGQQGLQCWANSGQTGSSAPGGLYIQWRDTDGNQDLMYVQKTSSVVDTGLFDGNWHHVVFTRTGPGAFNQSSYEVYLDGAAQYVDLYAAGIADNWIGWQYPFAFGARNLRGTIDSFLDCHIDELAIYDYDLSASRVQAHYNA